MQKQVKVNQLTTKRFVSVAQNRGGYGKGTKNT